MSLTLYLEATTTIPDLFIDYIEVRLASGESASLNWDESEIYRNPDGFGAKYTGVYFGEEPANGRLDELRDMVITDTAIAWKRTACGWSCRRTTVFWPMPKTPVPKMNRCSICRLLICWMQKTHTQMISK